MREIAIFSIIGFFFGCLFSCNNISNAIYDRKVYNVQRLSEKYLKINYSSKWETVEYEVKPFVDTLDHDKKNDIFFIKHTIRNSETYDSLLTTHQSTDTFMDGFKESQKLNKYLYFKVTNGAIIEPIDSVAYSMNKNRINEIFQKILNNNRDSSNK